MSYNQDMSVPVDCSFAVPAMEWIDTSGTGHGCASAGGGGGVLVNIV